MARALAITLCTLLTGFPLGALASDGLEFIPFVGYRFGGSFDDDLTDESLDVDESGSWGLILSRAATETTHYEFLYSHQDTRLGDITDPAEVFDLDIQYLHIGGSVDVSHDRFIPFFSGGVGMTHMSPGHTGYSNETRLSLSVGGGLKWYPTEQLGIRFEMRGYGTMMDTSGSLFCDSGCNLQLNSNLFPQFETNLGLIFHF